MSVKSYFGTVAETQELHSVVGLRSRYYKTSYKIAKAAVLEYVDQIKAIVKHDDEVHKEMLIQSNRYHIIVTFVQVTPIETSIDFKVEIYGLFGFHRPRNMILKFYNYLNNKLTFKGVGLHP